MLQETIYTRKRVGLIKQGFYFIRTTRAVWSRVQVVSRSRRYVHVVYMGVERYRTHRYKWRTRRVWLTERLPIRTILEARRYYM